MVTRGRRSSTISRYLPGSGRGYGRRRWWAVAVVAATLTALLGAPPAWGLQGPPPADPGAQAPAQVTDPPVSTDPEDRGPTAPGAAPLPAPGAQEAPGQTCFMVLSKVGPGQPDSDVLASGCRPAGDTSVPAVPGAPATGGPTRFHRDATPISAPNSGVSAAPGAAADSAIPIMELYADAGYGGKSFIIYGYQGPCDGGGGYAISDTTNQNSTVGGISSFHGYNGCTSAKIYNQTNLAGSPANFYGPDVPSLPAGYDNRVYSARERANCTSYPQTGYSTCGVIREKYEALGGPTGPLGYPTSNETVNPDNVGKRNTFQNQLASIYWTPATGANEIQGQVFTKWGALGYERGILGYPTSDEAATADNGGRQNTFFKNTSYALGTPVTSNGAEIWTSAGGAWEIHGPVYAKYLAMGGVRSCNTYPVSDVRESSMGPVSTFRGPATLPAPWNTYTPRPDTTTQVSVHTGTAGGYPAGTATSSCGNDGSIIIRPLGSELAQQDMSTPASMSTPATSDTYTSQPCMANAAPGSVCSGAVLASGGDYVISFSNVENGTAKRGLSAIMQCTPPSGGEGTCTDLVQAVVGAGSTSSANSGMRRTSSSIDGVAGAAPAQQPGAAPAGWEMNGTTPAMAGVAQCSSKCGAKYVDIDAGRMPFIAQNIRNAFVPGGKPFALQRGDGTKPFRQRNYLANCANFPKRYPDGSCDEYPFASSWEGGAGAQTAEVPKREQNCQGATLKNQYTARQIAPGTPGTPFSVFLFRSEKIPPGPYAGVDIAGNPGFCGIDDGS